MNSTRDDMARLDELLKKIPRSNSYEGARYAIEVSNLAGNIASSGRVTSGLAESSNAIQKTKDEGLKAALEQLRDCYSELIPNLDPETAARAADDLGIFTKEATSDVPRKKWLQLSAEGLLEAAKATAASVAPIKSAMELVFNRVSR